MAKVADSKTLDVFFQSGKYRSHLTTSVPAIVPDPPVLTFVSKDANSITVSSPGSVGAASYFEVVDGVDGVEFSTAPMFPHAFTGLSPGTEYDVAVKASNSAGKSLVSNTITQTTNAATTVRRFARQTMLYGTRDWTNPADEVARLAFNDVVAWTLHPGVTAGQYADLIAKVRAINPNIKILAYINCSEVQATSSAGVWGPYWSLINTNNWWARLGSGTPGLAGLTGTITTIQGPAINLASPRLGTGTYAGLTSGAAFIDLHFSNMGDKLMQVDGVLPDNFNFVWPKPFDWAELGATASTSSVAMRNAMIAGWGAVVDRVRFHMGSDALIYPNPRIAGNYINALIDDRAAFRAMNLTGFMNQNAGPGDWNNGEGIFAADGKPASPWGSIRSYPGAGTQPTSTPTNGKLYRNTFGGFKKTAPRPQVNPSYMDMITELHSYGYVADVQNILMECRGFSETEELNPAWPEAQQHNRYLIGLRAMSDVTPYILGKDTSPSFTGRTVNLDYQEYDWGNAIDGAGVDIGPYAVVGGEEIFVRRWQNVGVALRPRREDHPVNEITTQVTTCVIPTPAPPPGKVWQVFRTGAAVGPTITFSNGPRDAFIMKAVVP